MLSDFVIPQEWLQVPAEPPRHKPTTSVLPPELQDQRFRYGLAATLGIVGGLAVAKMALDHLFVHGLETKERRTMIGVASVAVASYGVVKMLELDERWLDVVGTYEKIREAKL